MYALVLDGEQKSALSAARELASAGVTVLVGSAYGSAPARYSRAASGSFTYTRPQSDRAAFVADLAKQAASLKEKPIILTFSDATHLTVYEYREELAKTCQLFLSSPEAVETLFDKKKTYDLARTLHIPAIPDWTADTGFPCVVKPRVSVSWHSLKGVNRTATIVFNEAEKSAVETEIDATTGLPAIVQKLVVGKEYGVEFLCKDGVVLLQFAHERVRSLSPRGGAATVKQVLADIVILKEVTRYAAALAVATVWNGPMMVEFKQDTQTKKMYLMEVNGRFWGSLPLALRAGVPFVERYAECATGQLLKKKATPTRRTVQRTQHWLGDARWLLSVLFTHDPLRPTLYPSRWSALRMFLFDTFFTLKDVWSWRDPLPGLMEIVHTIVKKILV
ncbi:MAG: ATP-grasp domain-containing protein [Patescibacteria group bacterium]